MSNILVRTLSGAVFISLILFPLFYSNPIIASCVLSLFAVLGIVEYNQLFKSSETIELNWKLNVFLSLLIFGFVAAGLHGLFSYYFAPLTVILFPILFIWALVELWRKKKHPIQNIALSFFGLIYVCVPFLLAININVEDHHSFPKLAGMFILIWTNDTFAYLSGRFFGRTKLFERISPKKTWEGTIGGILFSFGMAIALSLLFDAENLYFWLITTAIITPCAIFGDLLESLFKRSLNIKDSGTIMPGHGGILDRFDAALFALPFFFMWLIIYTYFC